MQNICSRKQQNTDDEEKIIYQICPKCGNQHTGACSADPIYFYWHPINPTRKTTKNVQIVGSWHKWQTHQRLIREVDTKGQIYFQLALNLPVGIHQYKYLVNGKWKHDPYSPTILNSYGSFNNVIQVFPKKTFMQYTDQQDIKISSTLIFQKLKIMGSWDNWSSQKEMKKQYNSLKGCQENIIYLRLLPNTTYQFKFKLRKQFLIDEKYPTVINRFGSLNNVIKTYPNYIETPGPRSSKIMSKREITCRYFEWQKVIVEGDLPYQWVQGHTMCNIGQYIYIFAGKSRNNFTNVLTKMSVHDFNNITNEEQLPNPRAFHSMMTYGNKIIIYGGHNQYILQDYHSFNVTQLKWSGQPCISGPIPQKRQKQSCVLSQMLLVFFGGYYCSSDFQYETIFNDILVLNIQNMKWVENINIEGNKPLGRFDHTALVIKLHMYIFGGCTIEKTGEITNFNDCWRLNLEKVNSLHWQKIEPKGTQPLPRHGHTMNAINQYIIIFGGNSQNSQLMNDLIVLDTNTIQWIYPIIGGDLPRPRYHHASTTIQGDYIMVFGGKTKDQKRSRHLYLLKPKEYKPLLNLEQQQ